ncbi:MAG: chromosomal replication initiator protein DnaA, partial [Bacteroidales bacterium]|nr:chromosomal replication initiator protein DnaA [Bacteroidales bacterium]
KYDTPFETRKYLSNLDPQLNPNYTFDNFLEGRSNALARTAGNAVAENPGKTAFNPLFIYGPSGVGKTHLMNAIGVQAKRKDPRTRVLYLSAQLFKVQYTDSIRQNRFNDFMNFYQTIDLLIMDDIQELSGVTATQNTFFHIFNHLQQNGKQIILSADKPPIQIQGLEDRLLTRFKWGLTAEMERPDYLLNKAILTQKIQKDGLNFPTEVVEYIARNVKDNVRDLEGVIVSLMAHSTFQNKEITLDLAKKELSRCVQMTETKISIDDIQEVVCSQLKLERKLLFTKSRKREIVQARQIAMYLAKKHTEYSLSRIGEILGKKDHATVLHACKTVKNQMEYDKSFSGLVNEIEQTLQTCN